MKTLTCFMLLFCGFAGSAEAQQQNQLSGVAGFYQQLLSSMRTAKTKEDVAKLIDATDTPDWISIDALGKKMTRPEAQKALEAMVATPPEKRVLPDMEVVWFREAGGKATVLMWVSMRAKMTDHQGQLGEKGKVHDTAVGSLVRDSLTMTPKGWRRTMHEKLIPDLPLAIDGVPRIHIPGTPPLPQPKN